MSEEETPCFLDYREAVHDLPDKDAKEYLLSVLDYVLSPSTERLWENVEKYGLSPREGLVLQALQRVCPRPITKESLLAAAYSDIPDDEWPQAKTLDVYVCKIRKKLRKAGADFEIETLWGLGHRLVPAKGDAPHVA